MTNLPPLKLKCSRTDCPNDLHYFGKKPRDKKAADFGPCIDCGADLIDWERVHARNINDAAATIAELQREWIRHHYWHGPLDQRAINRALKRGRIVLREKVRHWLEKKIGAANPVRDRRQTPWGSEEPTCYAQHATGSCCRQCVTEWYGIPQGRELTSQELDYLTELAMIFLNKRIPDLTDEPQHVPPIRKERSNAA